jgi:predicted transposase/invertase (TIGR01784 family)
MDDKDILSDGLPKILPPSENGVFKAVLTLPEAHVALVDAVAAFISRPVNDVTLRNNDMPARDKLAKQEEYDINCLVDGEDGDQCDVEMQASPLEGDNKKNDHRNIKWRSVFNLSDLHANQPGRGRRYGQFVKSYQVMLCNYSVFDYENKLVEPFTFRNPKGQELCDAVTAIFINLTQAKEIAKKPVSAMSNIEVWVVFFALADKPAYSGVIAEIVKTKEGIAVANDTLLNISQSPEERAHFRSRRIWLQDREHERAVWRDEAYNDARAEYEPLLASKDAAIAEQAALIAELRAQLSKKQ